MVSELTSVKLLGDAAHLLTVVRGHVFIIWKKNPASKVTLLRAKLTCKSITINDTHAWKKIPCVGAFYG
jgi:hypothetical protein